MIGGEDMLNVATYNMIERQWHVWNPSDLYCALKYHSVNELVEQFQKVRIFPEYENIYEEILKIADAGSCNWESLKTYDLTYLDNCLKSLINRGYIECNYRTRVDLEQMVTEIKIIDLQLVDAGKRLLESIEIKKNLDAVALLAMCLNKLKENISSIDFFTYSSQELGALFEKLCEEISKETFISFTHQGDDSMYMDYLTGMFVIRDIRALKSFVMDYNNFELENYIKSYIHRITLNMIDLKIIVNALRLNSFEMVTTFMDENTLLRHLTKLTGADYCRLDYFYYDVSPENLFSKFELYHSHVTEAGEEFSKQDHVIGLRELEFIASHIARALQQLCRQKDYKKYCKENFYLNKLIRIE